MNPAHGITLLALLAGVVAPASIPAQEVHQPRWRTRHQAFSLIVKAPYEQAFPLFGAYEERKWAKGFDPQFIHPSPPHDQQGMVFTTERAGLSGVWANTAFDVDGGHVQYIYFVKDTMVTLIDIHLTKDGAAETRVDVAYERTALSPEANSQVSQHAKEDAQRGAEWDAMINGYLAKERRVSSK